MHDRPSAAPLPVCVRRATASDERSAADLYLRARRVAAAAGSMPVLNRPDDDVRGWFAAHVMTECELWLAQDGWCAGTLLGIMALEDGWIEQLYVVPGRTGEGIGSALLEVARAERPAGLRLWTFQANTGALRFYARHGFIELLRTDGADNMEREPDALLSWSGRP